MTNAKFIITNQVIYSAAETSYTKHSPLCPILQYSQTALNEVNAFNFAGFCS
jgi:hypothetical protein